jgi:hypothetical protein
MIQAVVLPLLNLSSRKRKAQVLKDPSLLLQKAFILVKSSNVDRVLVFMLGTFFLSASSQKVLKCATLNTARVTAVGTGGVLETAAGLSRTLMMDIRGFNCRPGGRRLWRILAARVWESWQAVAV